MNIINKALLQSKTIIGACNVYKSFLCVGCRMGAMPSYYSS